jgi:putative hydrolase of HD superfamily
MASSSWPEQAPGESLRRQAGFLREIDRLKGVFRQTYLLDGSRKENDAEHSWHLAMYAMVLAEHANEPVDLERVLKMVAIHDLVEIDAGDTFAYDQAAHADKADRERAAADRVFGLLGEQGRELRALWDEFEQRRTPEARFAAAVDRLQPLLHNYWTEGKAWREHGVRAQQVLSYNARVGEGSETLGRLVETIVAASVEAGYLLP